jgi:hypothetical protein
MDLNRAREGARQATADVQSAANAIALVNNKAVSLMAQVDRARQTNDLPTLVQALKDADVISREMVATRASYHKAVEVASLVRAVVQLQEDAGRKEMMGDRAGVQIALLAAQAAGDALKKLGPIKIKLPPPTADATLKRLGVPPTATPEQLGDFFSWVAGGIQQAAQNIGTTVNNVANAVGPKLNQFGNWVVDNGPVIGGAVGAVIGSVVPGAGTAAGAAIGSALGAVLQATKPQVQQAAPPPPPPTVPNSVPASPSPSGVFVPTNTANAIQTAIQPLTGPAASGPRAGQTTLKDPTANVVATQHPPHAGGGVWIGAGAAGLVLGALVLAKKG